MEGLGARGDETGIGDFVEVGGAGGDALGFFANRITEEPAEPRGHSSPVDEWPLS
jgi:hypothetical protein